MQQYALYHIDIFASHIDIFASNDEIQEIQQ